MLVQVRKVEKFQGTQQDGTPYRAARVLMIFDDKQTALQTNIFDDVCDPDTIVPGEIFDMYRAENGRVLIFDKYQKKGEN